MDWSALNEKFREFDELCAQLSKECRPNSRNEDDRPFQIDVSSYKGSPLLCYSVLMPNELRPITYSNVTNQLLSELLSDEWFGNTGTLLRTLEKGVFHPVLHISGISDDRDSVELFRANKFGKSYTLYQAIYQELNVIELPVVTKKKAKNSSTDRTNCNDAVARPDMVSRANDTVIKAVDTATTRDEAVDCPTETVNCRPESPTDKSTANHELAVKDHDDYLKLLDCSDFSSTDDSGCVSLNSTATNEDYSSEETTKQPKNALHNSMESLESSYDSNDSMLNSISYEQPKHELAESIRIEPRRSPRTSIESKRSTQISKQINKSNLVNHLVTDRLIKRSLANELIATSLMAGLNDGHVIIGFRIRDEFFKRCFESNWLEMSGVRLLWPISASRFGLRRIKFLKRIGLNSERQGRSFDDGTTFNYILYAEFLNLTAKNEIYLSNFVHRLRLRSLGAITLYTNLN